MFTCILTLDDKDVYAFHVSWCNYSDIDPEDERLCNDHLESRIVQDLHTVFTDTQERSVMLLVKNQGKFGWNCHCGQVKYNKL